MVGYRFLSDKTDVAFFILPVKWYTIRKFLCIKVADNDTMLYIREAIDVRDMETIFSSASFQFPEFIEDLFLK